MYRIGQGYDVHRLEAGRKLMLGGIEVPFERGLAGHSDADVLLHAITDAVLGALAWGDIGSWFPDDDPEHSDRDSREFLAEVWRRAQDEGIRLVNLDATVLAERPKLRPYIDSMCEAIAEVLTADVSQISIKAGTNEKLGFVGREEGIAVHAVVLLET